MNRKISLGFFVVSIILFLLPWVSLSCGGTPVATLNGLDMVTGKDYAPRSSLGSVTDGRVDTEPLVVASLVVAVAGIVASLAWKRSAVARIVLGMAGLALLIALKVKLDGQVSREGQGMVRITYEAGYWLTVIAFGAAAAVSFLKKNVALRLTTPAEPPPPGGGTPDATPPGSANST